MCVCGSELFLDSKITAGQSNLELRREKERQNEVREGENEREVGPLLGPLSVFFRIYVERKRSCRTEVFLKKCLVQRFRQGAGAERVPVQRGCQCRQGADPDRVPMHTGY